MGSIGRIATGFQSRQASLWLTNSQSRLNTIQEKVATGRNINRPSDDPLGLTQIMDITRNINQDGQHLKNIATGTSELTSSDTALTQMVNVVQRAMELGTQGANVTTGADGMLSLSKEVDLLVDQLVQLGNSTLGEKYLFSGTRTDTVPYTRVGDVVTYNGTPQTQAYERKVKIDENTEVTINTSGDRILAGTASAAGVFVNMIDLKNDLAAGDTVSTRSRLDLLKADLNGLLSVQAELGVTLSRLESAKERTELRQDTLSQLYSDVQDIDMPQLITDLNFQEQLSQASLSVMSRILPQSLFNFIS
jgi:flagellar hook-associated protein 3 FlgL